MRYLLLFLGCLPFMAAAQSKQQLDSLSNLLEKTYDDDQGLRTQLFKLQKEFGVNADTVTRFWEVLTRQDSLNLIVVSPIVDRYGWLSENQVSSKANKTIFLVYNMPMLTYRRNTCRF